MVEASAGDAQVRDRGQPAAEVRQRLEDRRGEQADDVQLLRLPRREEHHEHPPGPARGLRKAEE